MGIQLPELKQQLSAIEGWRALPFNFIHINKCGGTSVCQALGLTTEHWTAALLRDEIGTRRWDALPSFAIVRNPYSRLTSLYRYRSARDHPTLQGGRMGLNEWIRRGIGQRDPAVMDNPYLFAPCAAWILDAQGKMLVDLVVRLENLAQEWPKVEELIGFRLPLSHENATKPTAETCEAALDPESIAIIQQRFRADFLLFGYDPDTLPEQQRSG